MAVDELLERGVEKILPSRKDLEEKIKSKDRLNVYLGIDPTATKIHLGHTVGLRKLQKFAELGHNVTFLIGDFTALIGDTSDKETERPILTKEEIEENFKTYAKQAGKILDFSKIKIIHNSEWLNKLNLEEILKLAQNFSLSDFIGRELIKRRLDSGKRVGLHELLYPIMQGYDSYMLDTDLQIGGEDQELNMQAGRILQKKLKNQESLVLITELLAGTDGKKMSKTSNNVIWIDDNPVDMYAKVMAIYDELIPQFFKLATNLPLSEVSEIENQLKSTKNPMDIKKRLALQITEELHGKDEAHKAQEHFENVFQKQKNPFEIPPFFIPEKEADLATIADIIHSAGLVKSKAQAKRVIQQGGTTINNQLVRDPNDQFSKYIVQNQAIIKIGKKNFVKVTTKS
jgi:tyrosyl-tRNA synthetase